MDVANSTEFCNKHKNKKIAFLYHVIYKICSNIIKTQFYPYAYIHETCGDSIFILVNGDFMSKMESICATLAIDMSVCILTNLNGFLKSEDPSLYMRCGISIGKVSAGVIDGEQFRVFGNTVHYASRLESTCKENSMVISSKIVEKLKKEKNENVSVLDEEKKMLKGFGDDTIYHLDLFKTKLKTLSGVNATNRSNFESSRSNPESKISFSCSRNHSLDITEEDT
jgi:Cdc6-like AAA superfamily ATPase